MSEQQFLWNSLDGGENVFIKERGSDKIIHIRIIEGKHKFVDFMKKVNEQHSIIRRDEISIKTMMSNMEKLEKENEDLREVNKESQRLHEENVKQCERWRSLYELKDAEVTARVKRLNEICNRYKYAITFDKDIDPNDAVNILCDRILQTEVEM